MYISRSGSLDPRDNVYWSKMLLFCSFLFAFVRNTSNQYLGQVAWLRWYLIWLGLHTQGLHIVHISHKVRNTNAGEFMFFSILRKSSAILPLSLPASPHSRGQEHRRWWQEWPRCTRPLVPTSSPCLASTSTTSSSPTTTRSLPSPLSLFLSWRLSVSLSLVLNQSLVSTSWTKYPPFFLKSEYHGCNLFPIFIVPKVLQLFCPPSLNFFPSACTWSSKSPTRSSPT